MDRLALVLDICVDCYLDAILHEALEGHDVLAREQARVEGELDVHRPVRVVRRELLGGGHGAAFGVEQRLASGLNHERAGEGVGAAELEILVVDGVHDRHLPARLGGLIAVGGVSRLRLDLRPLLVVERHPDGLGHPRVALDPEGLGDELVALIGLAGKLLQGVLAVRQRAEGVIGRSGRAVLAQPEPDAGFGVHHVGGDGLGLEQVVVGIGVVGVLVPARLGRGLAVAVGHQHVGLAGRDVGDGEGGLQARVGILCLLGELEVVADDLVVEDKLATFRVGSHDDAVGPDLEGPRLAVGEQVGVVGRGLLDGVGAIGQRVGRGPRDVGADSIVPRGLDHGDHLARLVPGIAYEDLVLGGVRYGELDAGERRADAFCCMPVPADRLGLVELRVGLGHLHAAAYRVVMHGVAGKVDDLAVALDGEPELAFPGKVAFRSVRLNDAVGAARQRVARGLRGVGRAVPGGGDGHDRLAVCVAVAVHVGVHPRCVDDGELGALERGVALLACAGLRIDLGDLHAAALPREAGERLGV